MSKYTEIREKNNCDVKQNDSKENIVELITDLKKILYRYRIVIKILILLIKDLKVSQKLYGDYERMVREKNESQDNYGIGDEDKEKMEKMYIQAVREWTVKLLPKKYAIDTNTNLIMFYLCLIRQFKVS
ncbi:hypothetical protein C922_03201 [Plasmodium inui San Antonio 1]|uniref:Uncharacterized protein n=1 Tax=Plasmodium inui San Antonio 1 TaxID=1237626 RepID=W7A3R1_9APIC|nr:hypothetical protein C922_03201 [Plasmodium inui San Antonio 1]EUD66285.1 hypothetical protein C922_03201 [Plasmodium inui San Antonio 1]